VTVSTVTGFVGRSVRSVSIAAISSTTSRLDASAGALERDQGVDAALSALQGAAYELVRLRIDPIALGVGVGFRF